MIYFSKSYQSFVFMSFMFLLKRNFKIFCKTKIKDPTRNQGGLLSLNKNRK